MNEAKRNECPNERVMRSCPGCGEDLFEDKEYFGVCTDCKEGATDLEELMDIATGDVYS